MAAVFCASLRRRAMVGAAASCAPAPRGRIVGGRRRPGLRRAVGCGAGASRAGSGSASAVFRCSSTSPLVSRPSFPVPSISEGSRSCSSTSLRTAGDSGFSSASLAFGSGFFGSSFFGSGLASAGACFGGLASACFSLGALALASPASMAPSRAPTFTVSPVFTEIDDSTPDAGAGTSSVTLSVSSSTSGSSSLTASPSLLNHCAIVASVTDSPSAGTRISVAISCLYAFARSGRDCPEAAWRITLASPRREMF
jgi:trimeric autotransporter adhesin